ncbi:MAG TPA: ATP-binding protein [Candidatus Polarisedimenticolia bacterium]|jgi:serine/threonine-protein kinase RsbW|nr:ATP-binding protein [Candidatus Polarisedimenticolia bacterium]
MQQEGPPTCTFDQDKLILRFESTIPAEVKLISPVVEGVMRIVEEMGCAAGKEFEVETALREALANAIVHGCRQDPTKQVQFWIGCDESRGMLIVVRDPGSGFDPAKLPAQMAGEEIFSTHGRGIYLINQLMDEVRVLRGGTEIHMRKS